MRMQVTVDQEPWVMAGSQVQRGDVAEIRASPYIRVPALVSFGLKSP